MIITTKNITVSLAYSLVNKAVTSKPKVKVTVSKTI